MKSEEKIAKKYFEYKGFKAIEFEPDGNVPPDFLLDNSIAVEVRRLNKFHEGKPLEKIDYNVIPKIENQINSFTSKNKHINSSSVAISYSRPLKYNEELKKKINVVLGSQLERIHLNNECIVNESLTLLFYADSKVEKYPYEVGGWIDFNKGGGVFNDLCDSLKIVIEEKEKKVKKFKNLYPEWWLVLIDNVAYGISKEMSDRIHRVFASKTTFKKIIFISPIDYKEGSEINMG